MIRIIIADDEYLARENLKIALSRAAIPNKIIGEAENGRELLDLVEDLQPDAVLADIRMPEMDGLSSIQYGRRLSPKTQWIVISGFSEFDYASRAIELSVCAYLLKPLKTEEVERALGKVFASNCRQDRQLFREGLRKYFDGLGTKELERQFTAYQGFCAAIFLIDSSLPETAQKQLSGDYFSQLQALFSGQEAQLNALLFALPSGEMTFITGWKETSGKENAQELFSRIARITGERQDPDFSVSVLEIRHAANLTELQKALSRAQERASLRFLAAQSTLCVQELERLAENMGPQKKALCAAVQELANAYRIHSFLFYSKAVDDFVKALFRAELSMPELESALRALRKVTGLQLEKSGDQEAFTRLLLKHGQTIVQTSMSENEGLMQDVVAYIDQNFMKDLSVNELADIFHISPSYFSILFKRMKQETFLKYLTRVRMIKAKELLLNRKLSIQTVAEMVGYQSARYFTKLFHDSFGMYPSDYRRSEKMF